MMNLIKFELRKILRMKTVYICIGIFFALVVLTALMTELMDSLSREIAEEMGDSYVPISAGSFIKSALQGSDANIFLSIMVAIYVCIDFSDGTAKNIFSRGYSRESVYVAKYIGMLIITLALFLVGVAASFIFGFVFFTPEGINGELFLIIFTQLLLYIAYSSVFYFISTAFSKLSGALVMSILSTFLFAFVFAIIGAIITNATQGKSTFDISLYWLDGALSSLNAGDMGFGGPSKLEAVTFVRAILVAIGYAAASFGLGFLCCRKKEV